jgi:hypothetical protein
VVISQHKAGESTKDGKSTNNEAVPTDDLLGERESEIDDEDLSSESSAGTNPTTGTSTSLSTRSGRLINKPTRLIEDAEAGAANLNLQEYESRLKEAEAHYYDSMKNIHEGAFISQEINCVGAGIGGRFANTKELHVMKYKQAMATKDVKDWERAVDEEHDHMVKHRVWQAILIKDIPKAVKIMTSTWAMKKKANGTFRARLNARGYEQVDGVHYNSHDISALVTNNVTIHIVLTLMIMAGWTGEILDVKSAFLHGDLDEGKNMYMGIPEGFEKCYDPMYYVLLFLQTLYGLKQSAMAFWKKLLMAFNSM